MFRCVRHSVPSWRLGVATAIASAATAGASGARGSCHASKSHASREQQRTEGLPPCFALPIQSAWHSMEQLQDCKTRWLRWTPDLFQRSDRKWKLKTHDGHDDDDEEDYWNTVENCENNDYSDYIWQWWWHGNDTWWPHLLTFASRWSCWWWWWWCCCCYLMICLVCYEFSSAPRDSPLAKLEPGTVICFFFPFNAWFSNVGMFIRRLWNPCLGANMKSRIQFCTWERDRSDNAKLSHIHPYSVDLTRATMKNDSHNQLRWENSWLMLTENSAMKPL